MAQANPLEETKRSETAMAAAEADLFGLDPARNKELIEKKARCIDAAYAPLVEACEAALGIIDFRSAMNDVSDEDITIGHALSAALALATPKGGNDANN